MSYTPELTNAETRLHGEAFWTILTFILNAALFALVGLQIPRVLGELDGWSTSELALSGTGEGWDVGIDFGKFTIKKK